MDQAPDEFRSSARQPDPTPLPTLPGENEDNEYYIWESPAAECRVINCDGALWPSKLGASAYVNRTRDGNLIASQSALHPTKGASIDYHEAQAILDGLGEVDQCRENTTPVILRSDSQRVINAITVANRNEHPYRFAPEVYPIIWYIWELEDQLVSRGIDISYQWVVREQNLTADRMAAISRDQRCDLCENYIHQCKKHVSKDCECANIRRCEDCIQLFHQPQRYTQEIEMHPRMLTEYNKDRNHMARRRRKKVVRD